MIKYTVESHDYLYEPNSPLACDECGDGISKEGMLAIDFIFSKKTIALCEFCRQRLINNISK